ncbi:MAG: hypothetical protein GY771_11605 [bacterium]|nr:hypothetical protein [bacterium]
MAKKEKQAGPKPGDEDIFKAVYEHGSFMYPTYALMIIMFLIITATSITLETAFHIKYSWTGLFANFLIIIPYFIQKSRRNEFIITNKRFIRNLKHPKRAAYEIPLKEIISVKFLSRAIDKYGIVQIRTTPEYGEQILIDGDTEYGVVTLFKVDGHADFTTTLTDAPETAQQGQSFDFAIEDEKKKKAEQTVKEETGKAKQVPDLPEPPTSIEEKPSEDTATVTKQPPPPPPEKNL